MLPTETSMSEPDKLFTDAKAYERLMGRWSRLVAESFLAWLNVSEECHMARHWLRERRIYRGADCSLCAGCRDGNRPVGRPVHLSTLASGRSTARGLQNGNLHSPPDGTMASPHLPQGPGRIQDLSSKNVY
jgi:hypothetical protein